ncbi:MAG: protease inhibitor I42 family protein [Chloroflexi bacterium]|nr:protease inhibitor I42 family protein [Chloroflexota bacterium]
MRWVWLVLALLGLSWAGGCTTDNTPPALVLGPDDDQSEISLQVGQVLEVHLPANPTTGYTWLVKEGAPGPVVLVAEPGFTPEAQRLGAGGTLILRFRAVTPGETRVRLVYQRPWETGEPEEDFEFRVIVR